MNIGILAYCSACNFGAQLQLLSTYLYLVNHGYNPIIINWLPEDLNYSYVKSCREDVLILFEQERKKYWLQTQRCITVNDVCNAIIDNNIDYIIIGSDAVAQHHPLLERIVFPTRRIISVVHPTSDKLFPNPFWGTFNDYLEKEVPFSVMSASSQDSKFYLIPSHLKKEMSRYILKAKFYSVRDDWTQQMISSITRGKCVPSITPDPVFAFNYNATKLLPSENYIREKYNIHQKYVIISFHESLVDQGWINELKELFNKDGISTLNLPYADHKGIGDFDINVELPISPIDWYSLIKYSIGYIGENMHPIVSALQNGLPVYAFDNYGLVKFNGLITSDKSSKIKHILNLAGIGENRVSCIGHFYKTPKAKEVYDKFVTTDRESLKLFSERYLGEYMHMMTEIEKTFGL